MTKTIAALLLVLAAFSNAAAHAQTGGRPPAGSTLLTDPELRSLIIGSELTIAFTKGSATFRFDRNGSFTSLSPITRSRLYGRYSISGTRLCFDAIILRSCGHVARAGDRYFLGGLYQGRWYWRAARITRKVSKG